MGLEEKGCGRPETENIFSFPGRETSARNLTWYNYCIAMFSSLGHLLHCKELSFGRFESYLHIVFRYAENLEQVVTLILES